MTDHSLRYVKPMLLVAMCAGAFACDSPNAPTDFVVSPTRQWAGGEVQISGLKRGKDTVLIANGEQLESRRSIDNSVYVTLPRNVNGVVTLGRAGSSSATLGAVEVIGFSDSLWHPVRWTGNPTLWPRNGPATFIAGATGSDVSLFHMATGQVDTLLTGFHVGYGDVRMPGLTPDPQVMLFSYGGYQSPGVEAWRLQPERQRIARYPELVPLRQLIQLSDSVFLQAGHHEIRRIDLRVRDAGISYRNEESQGGFLSPRGEHAVFRVGGGDQGIPVFDSQGKPVYYINDITRTQGVAFSPSGDTLYAVGAPTLRDTTVRVISIDAGTGQRIGTTDYPGFAPLDMTIDVTGKWLLVAMMTGPSGSLDGGGAHVLVVDRMNMSVRGHMTGPLNTRCYPCDVTIVDGEDGIFFAINSRAGGMVALRFERM